MHCPYYSQRSHHTILSEPSPAKLLIFYLMANKSLSLMRNLSCPGLRSPDTLHQLLFIAHLSWKTHNRFCLGVLTVSPLCLECSHVIEPSLSLSISTHDQNLKLLSTPNLASPERSPGYSFYNMIFNF